MEWGIRMRLYLTISLALLATACSQQSSQQNQIEAKVDLPALIAADDPTACASPEAIATALNAADQEYGNAVAKGMPAIRTDTVSATGINKDIHEITCSANGHARSAFSENEQSFPMVYKLRPALDQGGGFVAEIAAIPQVRQAISSHILWWNRQNAPEPAGEPQEEAATNSTEEATGPDGVKKADICKAEVLQEVASSEDPSSKMKPGEAYDDVTQFWRNKATGETRFCQHGGYCYPSHVSVNGQKVEAIRLTNCSVRGQVSEDEEDVLYGVW